MQKWVCLSCEWVYDPAEGCPEDDISPGTSFEDLPDNWTCSECGTPKSNFASLEVDRVQGLARPRTENGNTEYD